MYAFERRGERGGMESGGWKGGGRKEEEWDVKDLGESKKLEESNSNMATHKHTHMYARTVVSSKSA
jgi:hypothetical protein